MSESIHRATSETHAVSRLKEEGAADEGRREPLIARAWRLLVDGIAALGTVMIGVLMVIICADIVARNALGSSLPLVSELGALLVVMIVALQLATTVRADRLARTEMFIGALHQARPRLAEFVSGLFHLAGAAMVGLIAWSSVRILEKDFTSGEFIGTPGLGTLSVWPFRALILIGMTVAAIEFFVRAMVAIRSAFSGEAAHESR